MSKGRIQVFQSLAIFSSGVLAGLFGTSIFTKRGTPPPLLSPSPTHPIDSNTSPYEVSPVPDEVPPEYTKFGLPKSEAILSRASFITSINYRTRQPNWVLEVMTKESLERNVEREHTTFVVDPDVPRIWRARNDDYLKSGYSRGHLVPAADARSSYKAMRDTFLLSSNIIPQDTRNNILFWKWVEGFARSLIFEHGFSRAYIMSGPVWT
ncbi:hypothetical protein SeMB42_g08028, partial [Synchytrium endobioticum]